MGVDDTIPILKKNRMSTGIRDLDIVLEGGYINPGNVMLVGPAGSAKSAFAFHFAAAAGPNENIYFITADATPEGIKEKAASLGIKIKDRTVFIDCYSSTIGGEKPSESELVIPGPSSLNDLSLAINEAIVQSMGKKMRVVFYGLSTFLLYNPKDSILKFLQVVGGRLKKADATTLMLVEEGVHDKQLISTAGHMMDEIYTLAEKEGLLELELPSIAASVPIKLGPAGITVP